MTRFAVGKSRGFNLAIPLVAGLLYACIGAWWLRFVYLSDFFQMIWLADA